MNKKMTEADLYIANKVAENPNMDAEYFAFHMGRTAAFRGEWNCEISDLHLAAEWAAGYRSAESEIRLNNDTDWD